MPRYFLHLRDERAEILDPDGHDFADADALEQAMLHAVRELIAADAMEGRIRLDQRLDAEDAEGAIARSLLFADAVVISGR